MNLETELEMLFPGCESLVPAVSPPQEHRVCESQRCGVSDLRAGGLRQRRALLRFRARDGLALNNLCVSWPAVKVLVSWPMNGRETQYAALPSHFCLEGGCPGTQDAWQSHSGWTLAMSRRRAFLHS